jgi:hypothetical protein
VWSLLRKADHSFKKPVRQQAGSPEGGAASIATQYDRCVPTTMCYWL